MLFIVSFIWPAVAALLILRARRQQKLLKCLPPRNRRLTDEPKVAVIIPARNEDENIGRCVASLQGQDYPGDCLSIVIVDDNSTDRTLQIIESIAQADPRVTPISAPPLPHGWKGKTHACDVGMAAIDVATDLVCFIDADMRADPLLLRSAVGEVLARKIDLLSLVPRHDLLSFAERLIIPCGLYLLGFSQDLSRVQTPGSDKVVATGQFMLIDRSAYGSVGGHASVRDAISEDLELARLFKRRGYRVLLEDGSQLLASRMYTGWKTLWPGIAKNLTDMLGGSWPTVLIATIAVTIAWLAVILPVSNFAFCAGGSSDACIAAVPALIGSTAIFGLHIAGATYFGIPTWYGFLFPLGYTIGAAIATDSIRQKLSGRVYWKGRIYQ